jgi:small-conductance mechanosensitive channel
MRRLVPSLVVAIALLAPQLGHAQLLLGGLQDDADAVQAAEGPLDGLRATYATAERDFDDRLQRRQDEFRWRIERLESRRRDTAGQLQGWREREAELSLRGPERRELLGELLLLASELDGVLRDLIDAHDAELRRLQEAAAAARHLGVEVTASATVQDEALDTMEIDARLRQLADRARSGEERLGELAQARVALDSMLEGHQLALDEAWRSLYAGPLPDGLAAPELPAPALPDALAPTLPDALTFQTEPTPVPKLGAADRELLALHGERDRLRAAIFERRCDLDGKRLELVDLEIEMARLDEPLVAWTQEAWQARRLSAASREADGLLNQSPSPFAPTGLGAGVDHAQTLLGDPAGVVARTEAILTDGGDRLLRRRALLALLVVGLLLLELDRRLYRLVLAARPRGRGDELALGALRVLLPVLPVVVVCGGLLLLDLVPLELAPLLRFSAIAPPAVGAAVALSIALFPSQGSDSLSQVGARRARRLVQTVVLVTCLLGLVAALMPLLGFPAEAQRMTEALLLLLLLLGWEGILLRRSDLLALIGAVGPAAEIGVLRSSIRGSFRLLAAGPVVIFALYAIGYANLAGLLIRGGLVTVGVLLLAPWVHHRLRQAAERVLGYPDGGGWLALSPDLSKSAYRAIAPLLLLAVGLVSLSLLASGWNYGGDVLRNLASAISYPLWEVGQSRITGLSLLLFAVTLALAVLAQGWIVRLLERSVFPLYDLDEGMRATLGTMIRYLMLGVGVLIGMKVVGLSLRVLTVFAGVIGLAVGFGSQTLAANFMAGIMLLLGRRISVGDVIEVRGVVGRVVRISGYSTVVRTLDNLLVTVPNSQLLDDSVTNWTVEDTSVRLSVPVGVAYGSDTVLVRRLLEQAAREDRRVLAEPPPMVRFDDFADSALLFVLCPWVTDPDERFVIASDLRFRIDGLFREHGVEIAFPQQDVHLAGGEARIRVELETRAGTKEEG